MKKYLVKIISAMTAVITIVGICGYTTVNASQEEYLSGTIEVATNIGDYDMEQYIEDFEKKYPEVTVEYHTYKDYDDVMLGKIHNENFEDVVFIPTDVQTESIENYFASLGEFDELSEKYNYLESGRHKNNKVYGIPSSAYMSGILYNKDVFSKAGIMDTPKSIDEFIMDLEDIKSLTDAIPFYTNYATDWALTFWENYPYIEMTGNPNYREIEFVNEINPFLEGTTHYQVYKMLYDIVQGGLCEPDPSQTDWEKSKAMLNEGKIGCMAIGSWAVIQFKNAGPNAHAVSFMPFPNEIDGKQYMTIATDYCYGVNKNSKNIEVSKAFVEFMLDESGYALEHELLSMVRTDPYPDSYGDMENVTLLINKPATTDAYQKRQKLSSNFNIADTVNVKRVIDAAMGMTEENFDDIAYDWNERWESSRTPDMIETVAKREDSENQVILGNYEADFSQTELNYIKTLDELKIGYLKYAAPFQYEDENGFTGLSSDICRIIGENTGIPLKYYAYDDVDAMIQALQNGTIDIAAGVNQNIDYGKDIKFSKEYMSIMNVIVKNDTTEAVDISNMKQNMLATVKGEKLFLKYNDTKNYKQYDTVSEAVKAVENLEADYIILDYYRADYYIREQLCTHVTILPMSDVNNLCLAFSADADRRLAAISNKCIHSIPKENMQVMLREYLNPPTQQVTLRRFIEANPVSSVVAVAVISLIIMAAIATVMQEKYKSAKKHALDMERYEKLADIVNEYIFEYEYKTNIIHFDKKFEERFNFSGQFDLNKYDGNNAQLNKALEYSKKAQNSINGMSPEFRLTDEYGVTQWYKMVVHTISDRHDKPQHIVGKLMNVQMEMEEKLEITQKAERDPLTGLYNRDGFMKQFEEVNGSITFAVLDFDGFKGVNDALGHAGGDEALKLLAQTLRDIFEKNAIIARYGGDEFMLCIQGLEEEQAREGFSELVRTMDRDFYYQAISKHISISLGAVYSEHKIPFLVLFKEADRVLYETKNAGKNGYRLIHHLDEI